MTQSLDTSVPVTLVKFVRGLFDQGAVGLVRSLGRLGVAVYAFADAPWAPVALSRYLREKRVWDFNRASAHEAVDYLVRFGRKLGHRSILIPTDDVGSLFVADHAEALATSFIFPRQPDGLPRALSNKKELYLLCKQMRVPTPDVAFPESIADVGRFARDATFPIAVKSIDPRLLDRSRARSVMIARDADELMQSYKSMEAWDGPNVMFQEFIPGGTESIWMFNGYFNHESECLFGAIGQKIRQHPPYTGWTSLGVCVSNPLVEQTTKDFMKRIGYRGIVDLGYRYDCRDGQYKLLDVNPRIGGTFRLFVGSSGMDVARALYLDMTRQRVPRETVPVGRKWLVENDDLASSLTYLRDRKLSLARWLTSLRGVQETAWFARDDLAPFAMMGACSIAKAIRQLLSPRRLQR